jgi:uncharacterized protein (DUF1501 family)
MSQDLPDQNRRRFLKTAASLGASGALLPLAADLAAIGEAAAASGATDYKALVCVFLFGGNDHANTVVPYDTASHAVYAKLRGALGFQRDALAATALTPTDKVIDVKKVARQYALAPTLAPLLKPFNEGRMAVLLNVGTLIAPTTKTQYQRSLIKLPPRLFSHNDQQSTWQSSSPEGATVGWAGRIQDIESANNVNPLFSSISLSSNAVLLAGKLVPQFQVSTNGPPNFPPARVGNSLAAGTALRSLLAKAEYGSVLRNDYAALTSRALDGNAALRTALASAPTIQTAFPDSALGRQLKMVARLVAAAPQLGMQRQVFFVSLGGFDNHDQLMVTHPALLDTVSKAMMAFDDAMQQLSMGDAVTAFTASDFGRTLTINSDGSDHGWGSMHLILGGAVKGRSLYGIPPVVGSGEVDDVGQGRLLPTTSVDQYAATLGKWFGLSDAQLLTVLPNLANFAAKSRDVGFMQA